MDINDFDDTMYLNEENKTISLILTEKIGERALFFARIMQKCRKSIISDIGNMTTLNVLELQPILSKNNLLDSIEIELCIDLLENEFSFEKFSTEEVENYEISILSSLAKDDIFSSINI